MYSTNDERDEKKKCRTSRAPEITIEKNEKKKTAPKKFERYSCREARV